jgi:DNA polymerase-3 subunit gamma/tau
MEHFIVSARKYRPATFDTVVGQAHITNTLKNAIKTGHLAQAFLFCGPRGVGKTTCARILAKTINCTNRTANIEACDNCESCVSFKEGASLNVFELDAASNNSVDDIRNLVDQVRFAPQLGTHKVYIIDEVHMLSNAAFNAFLKTLEEPPKHAIFILATTEKHKIIPTILSRCQIFDFNRIQIDDIAKHLAFIAKTENIQAEPDALHIIAQKADGALRDACSIFDQIVSFAGANITYKATIDNLNILDYDYYFKVVDAIFEENISKALLLFNEILNNGFDGHIFVSGLAQHFRNLLVSTDTQTLQLLEVSNSIKEKYLAQSKATTLRFLVTAINLLSKTDINYKSSKNQRLQVELALMQLCSIGASSTEAEKKNDIIKPFKKSPIVETPVLKPIIQVSEQNHPSSSTAIKTEISQPEISKTAIKTVEEPRISQSVNTEQNNFSQQQMQVVWSNYATLLKQKGRMSLSVALNSSTPQLRDNYLIEYEVPSKAAEEAINDEKVNFLAFLRSELKNNAISFSLTVASSNDKKRIYTAHDKFKHLAEKNPLLAKFKQSLDLDIEL